MLRENILINQNHPSVLLWSIGNELPTPPTDAEAHYIAGAAALAHQLDPTRPVGMAITDGRGWPASAYAPLDVSASTTTSAGSTPAAARPTTATRSAPSSTACTPVTRARGCSSLSSASRATASGRWRSAGPMPSRPTRPDFTSAYSLPSPTSRPRSGSPCSPSPPIRVGPVAIPSVTPRSCRRGRSTSSATRRPCSGCCSSIYTGTPSSGRPRRPLAQRAVDALPPHSPGRPGPLRAGAAGRR